MDAPGSSYLAGALLRESHAPGSFSTGSQVLSVEAFDCLLTFLALWGCPFPIAFWAVTHGLAAHAPHPHLYHAQAAGDSLPSPLILTLAVSL